MNDSQGKTWQRVMKRKLNSKKIERKGKELAEKRENEIEEEMKK